MESLFQCKPQNTLQVTALICAFPISCRSLSTAVFAGLQNLKCLGEWLMGWLNCKQVIGCVPLSEVSWVVKDTLAGISSVSPVARGAPTVTQVGPVPEMLLSPRRKENMSFSPVDS